VSWQRRVLNWLIWEPREEEQEELLVVVTGGDEL